MKIKLVVLDILKNTVNYLSLHNLINDMMYIKYIQFIYSQYNRIIESL